MVSLSDTAKLTFVSPTDSFDQSATNEQVGWVKERPKLRPLLTHNSGTLPLLCLLETESNPHIGIQGG